ncbi:RNA-directed RNA polymerase [ssRNA phage SRR7976357_6]|uniref:RNA-directed RNA polymerase n=1 Tax=ssRNA phage SRR7976357_6 TaxID=2786746 RepID=A0A8S5L549_9VIRU|nr:RNA-directed RNA polymerase [ssRNA phage SRR7976357_6]DAD52824.1 TPA_asm: RNA-directed RNA polymerase [ssRNA phage SRR7976357_6]
MSTDSDVMTAVVQSLCERIDTPRALSVWLCFKHSPGELLTLPQPDVTDNNTRKFALDYFITEYLSKYKAMETKVDLKRVAIDKWILAEQLCSETNSRFRNLQLRPFTGRVEAALFGAQRKIAAVLGPMKYSRIFADCKWGPGATFDLNRKDAHPEQKMSRAISCTVSALPIFRRVVESDLHWMADILGDMPMGLCSLLPSAFKLVPGSRLLTVPKSAKTDRVIAAEPTGNAFLQQGVHSYMRKRLARFGIRLDDQSINQERARVAYSQGYATLDLSMASDLISREVVYHLLPLEWAWLLDDLRSHETRVEGKWVRTEKFASMGNAFCFELETLIFWALCASMDQVLGGVGDVTVFGDDIIVPQRSADACIELLNACGFTLNAKKSYLCGNFFESCGKHYHRGEDVTPTYQKESLNHPSELIRAHNRLVRLSSRLGAPLFSKALRILRNAYPLRPFPRIPFGAVEDGGFLTDPGALSWDRNHGYKCHVLDYRPGYIPVRESAMLAYKLRRFVETNPSREGWARRVTQGAWRTKVRWVHESSLGSLSEEPAS